MNFIPFLILEFLKFVKANEGSNEGLLSWRKNNFSEVWLIKVALCVG